MEYYYQSKHKGKKIDEVIERALPEIEDLKQNKADKTETVILDADGKVPDEKLHNPIKNLKDGEAEGSLKSKNASGAISKDAVALGDGCIAGSKCFNILAFDDTNKSYTLDSVEGLDVGDVYCLKMNNNYDNFGKITVITGNIVTVDNYQPDETSDVKYFRVPEKPTCGTTDFGIGALATGYKNKSQGDYSVAEGAYTSAFGRYAHTEGFETEAAFAGHAEGRYTKVLAPQGHTEGQYTEVTASGGHAEGTRTKVSAKFGHSEGYDTEAASIAQHVQGKFNIPDSNDKYAHIVGNGTSNEKRSNAHTLDWKGNAWFAGDVQSEKFGKMSDKISKDNGALKEEVANAIKSAKTGTVNVSIDDISPVTHTMGVKINPPNLLTYPYTHTTKTTGGITFTDNGDGTITANGTATSNVAFMIDMEDFEAHFVDGSLILSGCPKGGSATTYNIHLTLYKDSKNVKGFYDFGDGSAVFDCSDFDYNMYKLMISVGTGTTVNNLVFSPKCSISPTTTTLTVKDENDEVQATYTPNADGTVSGVKSIYPVMKLEISDTTAEMTVEYNRDIKVALNDKADIIHTHQTSDIYSTDVVAYDLSSYMGGWEYDGIAIGVEDKSKFLALDKFYMTYGDTVIETKPSSFVDDNHTVEEYWGEIHPEYYRGLHVFLYTGAEFDVQSHKQASLNPIYREINIDEVIENLKTIAFTDYINIKRSDTLGLDWNDFDELKAITKPGTYKINAEIYDTDLSETYEESAVLIVSTITNVSCTQCLITSDGRTKTRGSNDFSTWSDFAETTGAGESTVSAFTSVALNSTVTGASSGLAKFSLKGLSAVALHNPVHGNVKNKYVPMQHTMGTLNLVRNGEAVESMDFELYGRNTYPTMNFKEAKDELTENGLKRVWSKDFFLTSSYDYSIAVSDKNANNRIHTFTIPAKTFGSELPKKTGNIEPLCCFADSCSVAYMNSTTETIKRAYGKGCYVAMEYVANDDVYKIYFLTDNITKNDLLATKLYIKYELENPVYDRHTDKLYVQNGDKITFTQKSVEIFQTNNSTPGIASVPLTAKIEVPTNHRAILDGFEQTAENINDLNKRIDNVDVSNRSIGYADGVSDDSDNIQAIINSAETSSGHITDIVIPEGVYALGKSLTLTKAKLRLIGDGNVILKPLGNFPAIQVYRPSANEYVEDVTIENIKIYLPNTAYLDGGFKGSHSGIYINGRYAKNGGVYRVNVKDVVVYGAYRYAWQDTDRSYGIYCADNDLDSSTFAYFCNFENIDVFSVYCGIYLGERVNCTRIRNYHWDKGDVNGYPGGETATMGVAYGIYCKSSYNDMEYRGQSVGDDIGEWVYKDYNKNQYSLADVVGSENVKTVNNKTYFADSYSPNLHETIIIDDKSEDVFLSHNNLSKVGVYCAGTFNVLKGHIYDPQRSDYQYQFTSTSKYNRYYYPTAHYTCGATHSYNSFLVDLHGTGTAADTMQMEVDIIADNGYENICVDSVLAQPETFVSSGYIKSADSDETVVGHSIHHGLQDNALAYADKFGTVKVYQKTGETETDVTVGGVAAADVIGAVFDPKSEGVGFRNGVTFDQIPTFDSPIYIDISLDSSKSIDYLGRFGIQFNEYICRAFEVLVKTKGSAEYSSNGVMNSTIYNNTQAYFSLLAYEVSPSGIVNKWENVEGIRIVLKDALSEGDYNADKKVGLSLIYATDANHGGNAWLPRGGGDMYGDINMGENTISNIKEPVNNNDAVTKGYVDDKIIKNLTDGDPTGSLISSSASEVLSENAVALGNNSVAGAKCFKITTYNDTAKTYTLDSVKGLAIGDVFSLKLSNNYDNYGSITAINGNVVTVDKYAPNEDNSDNIFRVAAKPECGTTDFGMNAIAIGDNCKAVAEEAFSTGKDNVSLGKYGFTMGKNCKAAYGSFAGGRDISVLGQNSFGFGFGGYIPGTLSIGMGRSVKVLKNEALAFGYGAETREWGGTAIGWKSISASNKQTAIGCNNIIDEYGKYLYILGNGSYDTRSNAHTVDWSGNAWYAGDVESEKYGKLSEKISTSDGANAVQVTKSSNGPLTLDDISPLAHTVKIKIEFPNILTYPFQNTTKTEAGLTFTDNKDGSITVDGTSTSAVAFYFKQGDKPISDDFYLMLTGCPDGGSDSTYRLDVTLYNGKSVFAQYKNYGDKVTNITLPESGWDNYNVKLWIASGQTFDNVKITPKLTASPNLFTVDYGIKGNYSRKSFKPDGTQKLESTYPYMDIAQITNRDYTLSATYNVDTAKAIEATAETVAANKQDKINIDTTTDLYNDLAILKVNTLYKPTKGINGVDVILPSAKVGDFIQVDFYTISEKPVLSVEAPSGIMDLDLKPEQNKIYSLYFDWGVIGVDSNNNINEGWRFSYTEYDPLTISE